MPNMFIKQIINRIKGEKKRERARIEIEELKRALLNDPEFREGILRELEYRTGRRDLLKAGVLGLLGLAVGGAAGAGAAAVGNETAIETISDYTGVRIPKPCTAIVAQDGTGDYDVLPNEDASEAIQRAIDYAHGRGGGKVLIREGDYKIYNTIELRHPVNLEGEGGMYTHPTYTVHGTILKGKNVLKISLPKSTYGIIIKNLAIDGIDRSSTGIEINSAHCNIENISIVRCNEALILNRAWTSEFRSINAMLNNVGCNVTGTGTSLLVFVKCQFSCNYDKGMIINGGHSITLLGCSLEYNSKWGLSIESSSARAINIIGSYFEMNPNSRYGGTKGGHIQIGTDSSHPSVINIEGCTLGSLDPSDIIVEASRIYIRHGYSINIKGNLFYQPKGQPARIDINNQHGFGNIVVENNRYIHDKGPVFVGQDKMLINEVLSSYST